MITFGAAGAVAYSAVSGTSVAPAYPAGITAGQMLVLIIGQKPTTANGGTVATPAGWTLAGSVLAKGGFGSTTGAGVGNTNVFVFTKVAASETGTLTVTVGDNNVCWAHISRWATTSSGWAAAGFASGAEERDSISAAAVTTTSIGAQGGDMLVGAFVAPYGGTGTYFSAPVFSATGAYIPTSTEMVEPTTTVGNDITGVVSYAPVSNGPEVTGPALWGCTYGSVTSTVKGPFGLLRLRENPVVSPTSIDKVSATELLLAENPAYPAPVQKLAASELLLAENPAYPAPVQKVAAIELLFAETYVDTTTTQFVDAVEIPVASSGAVTRSVDTFETAVASSGVPARYIDSFSIVVASSVTLAAPTNDLWVWDGTTKIPANVTVWDGSAKIETSVSVT